MPETNYKFQLVFKGQLVENSVDAFDVANTILATSNALQEFMVIRYGEASLNHVKININAFKKGSLATDFILLANDVKDMAAPLIPVAGSMYMLGKNVLASYKTYINIKKFLKGKAPKKVEPVDANNIKLTAKDDSQITINYFDFRGIQSKELAKNVAKMIAPLNKESLLNAIDIVAEDEEDSFDIRKEDAEYLKPSEEIQVLNEVKYKGVVSKIDTKVSSGYFEIGSKRLPFNFDKNIAPELFDILVESLQKKVQIYVFGSVDMDYENNPKLMTITNVQRDLKLI